MNTLTLYHMLHAGNPGNTPAMPCRAYATVLTVHDCGVNGSSVRIQKSKREVCPT